MKYDCEVIRDLLPLYQDGVCSENSRLAVEEHLSECPACSGFLEAERSSTALEGMILPERDAVLRSQAKFFRRKSAVAGTVLAGIFMLPVLICLIVNLATGGLTWFLIVLAAMLIPFSLVAVPLLAPENKGLWMLGSFTVSLLLLLAVCCIFAGGHWFFLAASASLFGLSVIFSPFAVRSEPVAKRLGSHKGLAVMALNTVLFFVMMLCIGLTNGLGVSYYSLAAKIALPIIGWVWVMFLTVRYLPVNGLLKTAVCLSSAGILLLVFDRIFDLTSHSAALCIEAGGREFICGTNTLTAVVCIVLGLLFAVPGILKTKHGRNTK